jgi:hypothetical protein
MSELQKQDQDLANALILNGDLSKLQANQKVAYYNGYCTRLGLDPFTKPFEILRLNGKEVLYLTRAGAQQLNKLHKVSHAITNRELVEQAGVYQVTARAESDGRYTESIGAVNIAGLKGDAYANAIMKAETKAKRRATLDLLGLGILDETEVETIPHAEVKEEPKPEPLAEEVIESLHTEFMKLWEQYRDLTSDKQAGPYHPENWKARTIKAYQAGIKSIIEKIKTEKEKETV